MLHKKILNDLHPALAPLYNAWMSGWRPPESVSEEEYTKLREEKDFSNPLTGFAGFGLSFTGKWFGGYARPSADEPHRSFRNAAVRGLDKKLSGCEGAVFTTLDYRELIIPDGAVVYCDPPYRGVTRYKSLGRFDSDGFWEWAASLSTRCKVFVSEYSAPEGWKVIWEKPKRITANKDNKQIHKVEKLFVLEIK